MSDILNHIKKEDVLFWPINKGIVSSSFDIINEKVREAQWHNGQDAQSLLERQLHAILLHAYQYTAYYKKILDHIDLKSTPSISLEDFRKIPILTRKDVQDHTPEMHSTHPTLEEHALEQPTSGSTSEPVVVKWSQSAYMTVCALQLRWFRWAKLYPTKMLSRLYSDAPKSKNNNGTFQREWYQGVPNGIYAKNSSALPVSVQSNWLATIKAPYLMAYPSNAVAVLQYAKEHNIDLSSVEKLLTYGEVLSPDVRDMFLKEYGVEVFDKYSSRETGCMALKCNDSDLYHIQTSNVYLEILKEDNTPAEEGEVGKIVVTNLTNTAMPMIRYEIGDYATVGPKCECGRGLPTIKNIMGRSRNMAKHKNGESFWPRFHSDDFRLLIPVRQVQLIQKDYDQVHARYVSDNELTEAEMAIMHDETQKIFKDPVKITTERVEFIGREWGSKFEDFKCEI